MLRPAHGRLLRRRNGLGCFLRTWPAATTPKCRKPSQLGGFSAPWQSRYLSVAGSRFKPAPNFGGDVGRVRNWLRARCATQGVCNSRLESRQGTPECPTTVAAPHDAHNAMNYGVHNDRTGIFPVNRNARQQPQASGASSQPALGRVLHPADYGLRTTDYDRRRSRQATPCRAAKTASSSSEVEGGRFHFALMTSKRL